MRMTGQLQGYALRGRPGRIPRLMIEEDDGDADRSIGQCRIEIVGRPARMRGREVGHARQNDGIITAPQDGVPVRKHSHAQIGVMAHPRRILEEIFVVAGDQPDPVGSPEITQRFDVGATAGEGSVDQIAGDHDEIDPDCVGSRHDLARPARRKQAAEMQVRQVKKGIAVEGGREVFDLDGDIAERGHPHGLLNRDRRQKHGQGGLGVAPRRRQRPTTSRHELAGQRHDVERQLHRRQQEDGAEGPVEQDDQCPRKFG